MQATDTLKSEHRVIEKVLNCLEKIADRSVEEGQLDCVSARQAIDFLQHFADQCHHGKEEQHLFPLLEAKGFSRAQGPTGVMLHEHDQGRQRIRAMIAAIEDADQNVPHALQRFAVNARAYVCLLREHIHKEDHCLFQMVNQILTPPEQHALEEAFEHVETYELGIGAHEKYLGLANDLADRLDVPHATAMSGSCCHGAHSKN